MTTKGSDPRDNVWRDMVGKREALRLKYDTIWASIRADLAALEVEYTAQRRALASQPKSAPAEWEALEDDSRARWQAHHARRIASNKEWLAALETLRTELVQRVPVSPENPYTPPEDSHGP